MSIKSKLWLAFSTLIGTIGKALAADGETVSIDISKGRENFLALEYADKAQWILDTLGYIVNLAAVAVVLFCSLKLLMGGWGDLESELKGRKGLIMAIVVIAAMKIGLMLINLIISW